MNPAREALQRAVAKGRPVDWDVIAPARMETPADTALRELLIAAANLVGPEEDADQSAYTWAVCELADADGTPNPATVLRSMGWDKATE